MLFLHKAISYCKNKPFVRFFLYCSCIGQGEPIYNRRGLLSVDPRVTVFAVNKFVGRILLRRRCYNEGHVAFILSFYHINNIHIRNGYEYFIGVVK